MRRCTGCVYAFSHTIPKKNLKYKQITEFTIDLCKASWICLIIFIHYICPPFQQNVYDILEWHQRLHDSCAAYITIFEYVSLVTNVPAYMPSSI